MVMIIDIVIVMVLAIVVLNVMLRKGPVLIVTLRT